jgi:hypothetical protein
MKTLHLSIIIFSLILISILLQTALAQKTAHEILQKRDNMPATKLSHGGAVLIINQTIDKLEYKMGENITVHPEMINIGTSPVVVANGMPLFDIQVYQNGNKVFDSGYSGSQIVGWGFILEPDIAKNDTGTWSWNPHATTPVIKLDIPGKYIITSESNIELYDNVEQSSHAIPAHPVKSLWSQPLQITVLPEKYIENQTGMVQNEQSRCDKKISDERDSILNSIDKQKAILLATSDNDFRGLVGDSKYDAGGISVGSNDIDYHNCRLVQPNIQIQFNVSSPNANLGNCPYVIVLEDSSASKVLAVDLGTCNTYITAPRPNPLDASATSTILVIGGIVGVVAVGISIFVMMKKK